MMRAVERGGNRQELHERLREHSHDASYEIRVNGKENDLADRLANDPMFNVTREEIEEFLVPELYVGRAPEQTEEFLNEFIKPILEANKELLGEKAELSV